MDEVLCIDAALAADIERPKVDHPITREHYREGGALVAARWSPRSDRGRLHRLPMRSARTVPPKPLTRRRKA